MEEVQKVMVLSQEILEDQVEEVQELHQQVEQETHHQLVPHKVILEEQEVQQVQVMVEEEVEVLA